jgi:uncharacterized membrane protein YdjX (TVP38/TMEM64 family)
VRWGAVVGVVFILALAAGMPLLGLGERLREMVEQTGAWSPVVYVAAKAAATVVAPFSGVPLKAASGALFGVAGGIFYSVLGDVIGGCLCFWGARLLGRNTVERVAGKDSLDRAEESACYAGGWRALLLGRLALSSVYNLVSYAAGLTKLPFRQYLMVTVFGGVLHTSFLVALGASTGLDWKLRLVAYASIAVLALLALVGGKSLQRTLAHNIQVPVDVTDTDQADGAQSVPRASRLPGRVRLAVHASHPLQRHSDPGGQQGP